MKLTVKNLTNSDFGNYRCISKNSLGETEGSIRVYGKIKTVLSNYVSTRNKLYLTLVRTILLITEVFIFESIH